MKKDIIELFIYLDDFCKDYEVFMAKNTLSHGSHKKPTRVPCLAISEIMTIIILFHKSPCKNFKYFYLSYLQNYTEEFPYLPSYNRFVELQQRCLGHFHALLTNGVLKTDFQLVHTRHRSFINGFIHIFSTLVAYCLKAKKPSIKFEHLIPN